MFTLITNWYHEPDEARRAELIYCLNRNLEHRYIGCIWLLVEGKPEVPKHPKIRVRHFAYRPLFKDMITLANEQPDIVALANTDIYFDETLAMAQFIKPHECYALTRWDVDMRNALRFYGKKCSQDAWIFQPPLDITGGNYTAGKPGCDNKLAWEMAESGRRVTNPSKTIKSCHLHLTNLRRYSRAEAVPGPYLTLKPTYL
ncbi:hypothetical protein BH09BAC1_BH09BAC1_24330 [soil metagenome]